MRVNWTTGASQNLQQIEDYIAQDKPDAAVNTVLSIVMVYIFFTIYCKENMW